MNLGAASYYEKWIEAILAADDQVKGSDEWLELGFESQRGWKDFPGFLAEYYTKTNVGNKINYTIGGGNSRGPWGRYKKSGERKKVKEQEKGMGAEVGDEEEKEENKRVARGKDFAVEKNNPKKLWWVGWGEGGRWRKAAKYCIRLFLPWPREE